MWKGRGPRRVRWTKKVKREKVPGTFKVGAGRERVPHAVTQDQERSPPALELVHLSGKEGTQETPYSKSEQAIKTPSPLTMGKKVSMKNGLLPGDAT